MFKVGDKVKCVDNLGREGELAIDGIYTVREIPTGNIFGDYLIKVEECSDILTFYEDRFKPYNYRKEKLEKILYV